MSRAVPQKSETGHKGCSSSGPVLPARLCTDASRRKPSGEASRHTPNAADDVNHLLPGERWFAVQTQPRRELVSAAHLRKQGFRVFLPLLSKSWSHARRTETRLVALFPGYLFIILDLDRDGWRSVNGTIGVQQIVMLGSEPRPTPVPRGIVEAVVFQTDKHGYLRPNQVLNPGQTVQILNGPFENRVADIVALDGNGRVRLLIELLGGWIPATLQCEEVLAVRK